MPKVKSRLLSGLGGRTGGLRPSVSLSHLEEFENAAAVASITNQDINTANSSCRSSKEYILSADPLKDTDVEMVECINQEAHCEISCASLLSSVNDSLGKPMPNQSFSIPEIPPHKAKSISNTKASSNSQSFVPPNVKGCKRGADTLSDALSSKKQLNENPNNNKIATVSSSNIDKSCRSEPKNTTVPSAIPLADRRALMKENKYSKNNKGPFIVYIQPSDESSFNSIDALTIARILNKFMKIDPINIKKFRRNKTAVELKSGETANNLVSSHFLSDEGLFVFIPSIYVARFGVIRNIPTNIDRKSIDEIQQNIRSQAVVSSVKRLNRRIKNIDSDNDYSFAPSKSFLLKFEDQTLPKRVILDR